MLAAPCSLRAPRRLPTLPSLPPDPALSFVCALFADVPRSLPSPPLTPLTPPQLMHSMEGVRKGMAGPNQMPVEVMGLMLGRPSTEPGALDTIIVTDVFALPVEVKKKGEGTVWAYRR